MIKKITVNEYQKRFDNMTGAERQVVTDRVGQWLSRYGKMLLRRAEEPEAQLQNVMQVSGRWNDEECRAWEEGAQLLSPLFLCRGVCRMPADWLPREHRDDQCRVVWDHLPRFAQHVRPISYRRELTS